MTPNGQEYPRPNSRTMINGNYWEYWQLGVVGRKKGLVTWCYLASMADCEIRGELFQCHGGRYFL
jgi:hypothetical protein